MARAATFDKRGFRLVVRPYKIPMPVERWQLLVGECVHNMRSTLDNLAFALARLRLDPPPVPGKVSFPICTTKAAFRNGGKAGLMQLPVAARDRIAKLQPFNRDGSDGQPDRDQLVLLNWLSNVDKHRMPTVVAAAPTEISHEVSAEFFSEADAIAAGAPQIVMRPELTEGSVLLEWTTTIPIEGINGKFDGKVQVFLKSQHNADHLVDTLVALHNYLRVVVGDLASFFVEPAT